jgi:hypothetical protein
MKIVGNLRRDGVALRPGAGLPPIGAHALGRKVRASQSAVITAAIVARTPRSASADAGFNGCFCAPKPSDKHITLTASRTERRGPGPGSGAGPACGPVR